MIVTDLLIYLIKTPHCSAWPVTAKTLLRVPGGEMQGYKLRGGRAGELHYWRKRDQRMDNFLRLFSYFFILAQESSSVESLLINFGTHFPGSRFIDFQLRKATLVSHSGPQCQLWQYLEILDHFYSQLEDFTSCHIVIVFRETHRQRHV